MEKVDGKKLHRELYAPSAKHPTIVQVPEFSFLKVAGSGPPEDNPQFSDSIGALYGACYTLKFMLKKRPELASPEYAIMPLEALWWSEDHDRGMAPPRGEWTWELMIWQPDFITADLLAEAKDELQRKGKATGALEQLRLEPFDEGLSVQMLHIGSYASEAETMQRMLAFAQEQGYAPRGRHHEIYLSDPSRTPTERLKTVIRHPVSPGA